jgi:twitching motility two-component system response regulator PilG
VSEKPAQKQIIEQAITRYESVINREKNICAHYYCGIAHLNLGNWEDGLNHLHTTVNLAPKNTFLMEQLRLLLDHMDSIDISSEQTAILRRKIPKTGTDIEKPGKKPQVLIVEDSSTTRKVIAITLSRKGYVVVEAEDGLEALSKVNETRPDLVLLDIILPKINGYKVLSIIKNSPDFKDIPVIMLTSKDAYEHRIKGKLAGSTAYLTKPFDPVELLDMIENTLANVPMI